MKPYLHLTLIALVTLLPIVMFGQNKVGIGTTAPTEKLEVSGIIYTNTGGVRFPDETLQETAAFNSNGPEDAANGQEQPFMTIVTTGPAIPDTMYLLHIEQGGFSLPTGGPGAADFAPFRVTKELDKATPLLFRKGVTNAVMTTVRIHYTKLPPGETIYETIELRNASVKNVEYKNVYRGDGTYAHLEIVDFGYDQIEVKYLIGTDVCYCWNIPLGTNCSCD